MRIKDFTDTIRHLTDPFNIPEARRMIAENPALTRQQFAEGQLVQPGPGRQGFADKRKSPTKINEDLFTKIDDLIADAGKAGKVLGKKGLGEGLGYKVVEKGKTAGQGGLNKVIEAWEQSRDTVFEYKPAKFTADNPKVKQVIELFESGMKKRAIAKQTGITRKEIRSIFHQFKPEYIGETNAPTGEGKWGHKRRRQKLIKELEAVLKKMPGGQKTLDQTVGLMDSIWAKNDEILKMTDDEIWNNKLFREAMNLDVTELKAGKGINFNRYANLTKEEFAAKVRAMAGPNSRTFYQPEHIIPISSQRTASLFPKNIQVAIGKTGGQMETLKNFVKNSPDSEFISEIDEFLTRQNVQIQKPDKTFVGFKGDIVYDTKTGTSNIVESSFKKTVPIVKQTKLVSFPANLADVKLSKAVKGWRGGALFEIVFGLLDYWNEESKGKEGGWGGQAMANAIQTASFGILKTGDKKYVYELLRLGKEMGFDTTALEHVIDINKRDNVLAKVEASNVSHLEAIKKKIDETTDPEMKEKLQEIYNERKMKFATNERLRAEETNKIFDTYIGDLRAKKAGPPQLVSPEKLAATDITQEEANVPFENIWTTATEQLKREKTKVFPEASKRLDYEAGMIGDPLQTHIFNVPAWSGEHEAFGLFNPTPKQEERAHLDSLIKLAEEGNPEPLREYNERRGVYEDQPISRQSLINLTEQHPWLGYRIEEAAGGIVSLLKK